MFDTSCVIFRGKTSRRYSMTEVELLQARFPQNAFWGSRRGSHFYPTETQAQILCEAMHSQPPNTERPMGTFGLLSTNDEVAEVCESLTSFFVQSGLPLLLGR